MKAFKKTAKRAQGAKLGVWLDDQDQRRLDDAIRVLSRFDLKVTSDAGRSWIHCVFSAKENLEFINSYWDNWKDGFETDEDAEESFIENFRVPVSAIQFIHAGFPLDKDAGDTLETLPGKGGTTAAYKGDYLNFSAQQEALCQGDYVFFDRTVLKDLIAYRFERR